jgi:vacuolar-type H+-ATPase subunit I/STV1
MEDLESIVKDTQVMQSRISELIARHKTINHFEQGDPWKRDAQAVIPDLEQLIERLRLFISTQEVELAELQAARSELSVTKKLFTSRKDEKSIEADIAAAREAIDADERTIAMLHAAMDSIPSGKLERKEMLKALKSLKKQLTAEKRAINQQIRAIKVKASLDLAQWKGVTKGTVGKAARHQRASIRLMKKAQLEPQETARAAVKRQINEVNQRIKWVSNFSGDEG